MADVCFCKTEIVTSRPWIEISWRYLVYAHRQWLTFWRKWRHPVRYGGKIAPQRPPSWKPIRRHISAVSDPILVKCGMLTHNDMTITAMGSKSKLKKVTDWKRKIAHWSCWYVSPGCYSNARVCVFAGVAQLHNLLSSGRPTGILYAQITGRFYYYVAEMAGSVCLKL